MQSLKLVTSFQDGSTQTFTTRFPDLAAWEAETNRTVASWGESGLGLRDLALLAYMVAKREQFTKAKFGDFLNDIDNIEVEVPESPKATAAKA